MYIFGRIVALRRVLRALRRLRRPAPPGTVKGSIFGSIAIAEIVTSLERDGLFTGIRLPQRVVDDLLEFAEQTPCYSNHNRGMVFQSKKYKEAQSEFRSSILTGHYLDKMHDCARVRKIQRDPLLAEIANRYLLTNSFVINTRMWWSFPCEHPDESLLTLAGQDLLHFDMDDWSCIKFFFYLTEVDVSSGPHVYVRRSHRRKRLRDQFTIFLGRPVSKIIDFYGRDNVVTICGPAGFGFVEDPFGFHMGTVAQKDPRLVLEIEYGVSDTAKQYLKSVAETDSVEAHA
jgi:hypothetical protein